MQNKCTIISTAGGVKSFIRGFGLYSFLILCSLKWPSVCRLSTSASLVTGIVGVPPSPTLMKSSKPDL